MRLTYIEHACVFLEGTRRVLIDPYVLNKTLPGDPDLVVVTHGHFDHLGETLRLARPTVTTNEIAKELAQRGLSAEGINAGGGVEVDGVRVTMTQAVHSHALEIDGERLPGGDAAGMVVEMDGVTVYHAGDTAIFGDMRLLGELYQPTVGLINVGVPAMHRGAAHGAPEYLTGEMDAREAALACGWLGLRYAIPCHHDDPDLPEILRFRALLEAARREDASAPEPVILRPGEAFTIQG